MTCFGNRCIFGVTFFLKDSQTSWIISMKWWSFKASRNGSIFSPVVAKFHAKSSRPSFGHPKSCKTKEIMVGRWFAIDFHRLVTWALSVIFAAVVAQRFMKFFGLRREGSWKTLKVLRCMEMLRPSLVLLHRNYRWKSQEKPWYEAGLLFHLPVRP